MRLRLLLLALVASLPALTAPALAQRSAPGPRVRVVLQPQPRSEEGAAPDQMLRGRLLAVSPDSLTLQIHPGASPIRLTPDAIRRMEVSRGIPSRPESALRTGAWFAALGAVEFPVLEMLNEEKQFESAAQAALVGAAVGAGTGAVLGALFPRERWKRVRWEELLRVGTQAQGAVRLELRSPL